MNSRDAAMIAAAVRAGMQPQRQPRRGCGCTPFWVVLIMMLPCDILFVLAATGLLQKLLAR